MTELERKQQAEPIKGYKVFNPDWTCMGKQYTCPGKFEENIVLSMCGAGMHFCKKAGHCFNYYDFDPANHVAEVISYGDVIEVGDKCCTNKLEIVREIPWAELLAIVNTGKGNTGKGNSGDYNSGDNNSGHCNSGDENAGNYNSRSGNSGDYNSGYCNSGHFNDGDFNSGDFNSGSYNSGHFNSGDYNSGDWNECDFSSGCFNTEEQKIYFFNQPSDWTYRDWVCSEARKILSDMPKVLEYVQLSDMTDEERKKHPEAETTGGYLREMDNTETVNEWWKKLKEENKEMIMSMPNFDRRIFKQITGIDVDAV
ncbi:hypothetical protein C3V36_00105 [Lachnospiraceae bacterium oral taxon 500]|nr:hypothetical protein C3V36_00105 [Lachnospiraceae bacterium oral taxon 500]